MSDDLKDKQYLALELTKICYGNKEEEYSEDIIYETYENNLKKLTNTIDEIEPVTALKNEIAKLQKENKRLKLINQDSLTPFANDIMSVLVGAKGDMEPYVYDSIVNIIKAKIQ